MRGEKNENKTGQEVKERTNSTTFLTSFPMLYHLHCLTAVNYVTCFLQICAIYHGLCGQTMGPNVGPIVQVWVYRSYQSYTFVVAH